MINGGIVGYLIFRQNRMSVEWSESSNPSLCCQSRRFYFSACCGSSHDKLSCCRCSLDVWLQKVHLRIGLENGHNDFFSLVWSRVVLSFRCSIHVHAHACTSMHTIHAHPFLSTWHSHCRLNLFLQMLPRNKLCKKESLKRREMVKKSWAYSTFAFSLQELLGWDLPFKLAFHYHMTWQQSIRTQNETRFFSSLGHEKWMSRILKLEVHLHIIYIYNTFNIQYIVSTQIIVTSLWPHWNHG